MKTDNTTRDAVPLPQSFHQGGGSRKVARGVALLLLVLVACTGCSTGKSKWKFAKLHRPEFLGGEPVVPDPEVPSRLVATWTDTVLNKVGQPSQRGFGGRLIFFKEDSQDPVRVDGQLVIYAFDETDRAPHETQPSRRYIFPREEFARHESPSKVGASYSVWLPWDDVGGPQKKISLIARFEPEGGAILLGEQTRHLLPGVSQPEQQLAAEAAPPAIQRASYTEPQLTPAATPDKSILISTAPAPTTNAPSSQQQSIDSITVPLPRRLGPAPPRAMQSLRDLRTMPTASIADQQVAPLQTQSPTPAATPSLTASAKTQTQAPVDRAQQLRDSVRATHPARAPLTGQPAPGRAQ